ncbi:MAG: winged helix-turn-helix transcriptional regulator, partial [Promethearchaeia archaeon]
SKKIIGKFLAYFPYYNQNPISNLDLSLSKSKVTLKILKIIIDNPGICNKELKKELEKSHTTIKYHTDKLIELGLLKTIKDGRKKRYYPNLDSEYFKEKI